MFIATFLQILLSGKKLYFWSSHLSCFCIIRKKHFFSYLVKINMEIPIQLQNIKTQNF